MVMKVVEIQRTDKTPEVTLDTDKQLFQIKGNCLPENIRDFGNMVIEKLETYLKELPSDQAEKAETGAFRMHFRLGYFNSAAAKFLADLLITADHFIQQGCYIKIYWYFDEDDHDMLEAGEEISHMVNVPMEYIAVTKG